MGAPSQAVQAWFHGTRPNNLTRKAISKFLKKFAKIELNISFMSTPENETFTVQIKSIPPFGRKLKWTMLHDSQHYDYEKFRDMLSNTVFREGDGLELYIVNEEIGQLEPIRINLEEIWLGGLTGGNVVNTRCPANISKQMERLRLF